MAIQAAVVNTTGTGAAQLTNLYGEEITIIENTDWYLIEPEYAVEGEYYVRNGTLNDVSHYNKAAKSHARKKVVIAGLEWNRASGNVQYYLEERPFSYRWVSGDFLTTELRPKVGKRAMDAVEKELRALIAEKLGG